MVKNEKLVLETVIDEITEDEDTYSQDIIFTRETVRIFEIWDKVNNEVCHGLRECYEDDLYMSEDDFEEITWDGLFEFRYVYSGEVIESFNRLREFMIIEDCSGLKC